MTLDKQKQQLKKVIWLIRFLMSEIELAIQQIDIRVRTMNAKALPEIIYETEYNWKKKIKR